MRRKVKNRSTWSVMYHEIWIKIDFYCKQSKAHGFVWRTSTQNESIRIFNIISDIGIMRDNLLNSKYVYVNDRIWARVIFFGIPPLLLYSRLKQSWCNIAELYPVWNSLATILIFSSSAFLQWNNNIDKFERLHKCEREIPSDEWQICLRLEYSIESNHHLKRLDKSFDS